MSASTAHLTDAALSPFSLLGLPLISSVKDDAALLTISVAGCFSVVLVVDSVVVCSVLVVPISINRSINMPLRVRRP